MPELTYHCAACGTILLQCRRCQLMVHPEFPIHLCADGQAGKMLACPHEVVTVDVPEVASA